MQADTTMCGKLKELLEILKLDANSFFKRVRPEHILDCLHYILHDLRRPESFQTPEHILGETSLFSTGFYSRGF